MVDAMPAPWVDVFDALFGKIGKCATKDVCTPFVGWSCNGTVLMAHLAGAGATPSTP